MPRLRSLAIVAVLIAIAGCAPWSSYPPIENGGSILNPRFEPVPTLLSKSIRYVHQNYGLEGAYSFALPVGMPESLPGTLTSRLGPDATHTENPVTADYRVLQVRARGSEGEVDLTYRRADGLEQMVTVTLEKPLPLEPYRIVHAKSWRIRTDLLDDVYAAPEESIEPVESLDAGDETTNNEVPEVIPPTVPPGGDDNAVEADGANARG